MNNTLKRFWNAQSPGHYGSLPLLFLLYTLGTVIGAIIGCYTASPLHALSLESYVEESLLSRGFLDSLANTSFFIALTLLFGTSFLGVFLIPSVVLVKAYTMSCSVATFYAAFRFQGLLCVFFSTALPALVLLPCFLSCSYAAMLSAQQLYAMRFHTASYGQDPPGLGRFVLLAAVCVMLFSLYDSFLLPLVLKWVF